jgi:ribonucleoside-triphosphate reductase
MPGGNYYCQESFRLVISGDHVDRFAKLIGFENQVKFAKLINGISTMTRGFYIKPMVGTVIGVADGGTLPVYDCTVPDGHAFVANGTVVHNCGEVGLNSYDVDGLIAGESCNLGSIDLDVFGTDHEGAKKAFQLMARFLYRSTLNPHRDSLASHIETSNRRIGVGIMGLQGWTAAHGVRLSELEHNATLRHLLSEFRQTTRSAADAFARELGLPLPLKVTAVAPTGSIAQLRGSQPGIHPVYARYFKRRVRYSKADLGLSALRDAGHHVEDDLYAANTSVVEFFVKDSILDRYEESLIEQSDELSADQFFGLIATVQETFCGSGDGNAVSATAQIAPDMDAEELSAAVRGRLGTVKGLTVFPSISRPQSPYETISAARYSDAVLSGLAQSSGDSNSGGCVGGACPIR